ncbi:YHYH protein [Mucilaginibacter sp. HMF5004]|uniref:YHYH protein n=1 Tax=Mucilaginibacter rivuli TaxID=2857527 RepID=UPI001C5EFDA0|nr:YHYH protein [Mucilaginibacter rivuli]MBW4891164.1 YHYH protein [Mucilaginibacter rivuli]
MKNKAFAFTTGVAILLTIIVACKKSSTDTGSTSGTVTIGAGVPDVFKKIYGATSIYIDGNYVVIKATSLPDHKSPYYQGTQWASTKYEAYNGTNTLWNQNPNSIAESDCTYKIPLNPVVATTHATTPGGPIGVAINGVPIFNQYAAMGAALTGEINSFDQYDGHPQQQGQYHYHAEPYYLTANKGKDALLGFLLDGFPLYGPTENGKTIANSDLDVYHGHTTVTADYPNGIYHYHTTAASPYINGNGFYGTAGTVTN